MPGRWLEALGGWLQSPGHLPQESWALLLLLCPRAWPLLLSCPVWAYMHMHM